MNFNIIASGIKVDSSQKEKNHTNLTLLELVNKLNQNKILNPLIGKDIDIIFESYDWLNSINLNLNNFISKNINEDGFQNNIAHYDKKSKSIYVSEYIVKPENNNFYSKTYNKFLSKVSNKNFIVNFFILHEIGYSIYDHIKYETTAASLIKHFNRNDSISLFYKSQELIINENFADMFAAISLLYIDKNNYNIISDLEYLRDFRKVVAEEKHYTFNNLDKIIKNYNSGNLMFSNNEELLFYINRNINEELKILLKNDLENSYVFLLSKKLGYLSKMFKSIDIVEYLKFNINYKHTHPILNNEFILGENNFIQDINFHFSNKIVNYLITK